VEEINAQGLVPFCEKHNVYFDTNEGVWFKRFDVVADLLDARTMGAPVDCPLCKEEATK